MSKILVLIVGIIFNPLLNHTVEISEKIMNRAEKQIEKQFKEQVDLQLFNPTISTEESINSSFYHLKSNAGEKLGIAVITHANGCLIGGCSIDNENQSRYEKFYILSIYNEKKELIRLHILEYPGEHGYEITTKWWLKQFLGSSDTKFKYRQNIDALSGATVSSQTVVNEVNQINAIISSF